MSKATSPHHAKTPNNSRLVHRGGVRIKIARRGIKRMARGDFYIKTLGTSWLRLILSITVIYVLVNLIFAGLYLLEDGSIENARPGSFADAFFFSVQTLATIGYGKLAPATTFANILVAIEALAGLSGLAVATGVIFSKISRPNARVLFSNSALISSHDGVRCFMFRLGNLRSSQIADPTIKATLICDELSENGRKRRVFHDLHLVRSTLPILMPSWTIRHQVVENSPIFSFTKNTFKQKNVEIIVSMIGFDEVLAQNVHAYHSYVASEIIFGGNFVDIISWDKKSRTNIDYKKFHDVSRH